MEMQITMSCFLKAVVTYVILFLPLLLHGKSGPAHIEDMHAVFGPSEKYDNLNQMFEAITRLIDDREKNLTSKLREIAPEFTEGSYSHRIYFHWGFNGKPEDSMALNERIKLATDDMQVRRALFDRIRIAQKQRNDAIMRCVQKTCSGKALKRREKNAIAALAYDTHILGDYIEGTENTTKALMPMEKLMEDICTVFRRLVREDQDFRDNPERKPLQKDFERKMKQAAKVSGQMDAAKQMLRLSKDFVPRLLRMTGRVRNALQLKDLEENSAQGGGEN